MIRPAGPVAFRARQSRPSRRNRKETIPDAPTVPTDLDPRPSFLRMVRGRCFTVVRSFLALREGARGGGRPSDLIKRRKRHALLLQFE
jgi:hypothetical protein